MYRDCYFFLLWCFWPLWFLFKTLRIISPSEWIPRSSKDNRRRRRVGIGVGVGADRRLLLPSGCLFLHVCVPRRSSRAPSVSICLRLHSSGAPLRGFLSSNVSRNDGGQVAAPCLPWRVRTNLLNGLILRRVWRWWIRHALFLIFIFISFICVWMCCYQFWRLMPVCETVKLACLCLDWWSVQRLWQQQKPSSPWDSNVSPTPPLPPSSERTLSVCPQIGGDGLWGSEVASGGWQPWRWLNIPAALQVCLWHFVRWSCSELFRNREEEEEREGPVREQLRWGGGGGVLASACRTCPVVLKATSPRSCLLCRRIRRRSAPRLFLLSFLSHFVWRELL